MVKKTKRKPQLFTFGQFQLIESDYLVVTELEQMIIQTQKTNGNFRINVVRARLTELHIENNYLQSLPATIGSCTALERINLRGNLFQTLPESLFFLPNLRWLNITNNPMRVLPPNVHFLPFYGHRLKKTDYEILLKLNWESENTIQSDDEGNLIHIGLTQWNLKEIPDILFDLSELRTLDLHENHIHTIPPEIRKLHVLETIDLAFNDLTEFPLQLLNLRFLRKLNLADNRIKIIPDTINQLINLEVLYIQGNFIKILPPNIEALQHLIKLDISNNQISELPIQITHLTNLVELYASGNLISQLPKELDELIQLEELSLNNNRIHEIPVEIFFLPRLQIFDIRFNPIQDPPRAILQQGIEVIRRFIRQNTNMIPIIIQKIHDNSPLTEEEISWSKLVHYATILEKECLAHPTTTAQQILRILKEKGFIPCGSSNFEIWL